MVVRWRWLVEHDEEILECALGLENTGEEETSCASDGEMIGYCSESTRDFRSLVVLSTIMSRSSLLVDIM